MTTPTPPAQPRRRNAEKLLIAQALADLRYHMQTQTEQAARLAGQLVNQTLEVYSGVFDATGIYSRTYHVAIGSIEVNNLGVAGHNVVVSSNAPGSGAPTGTGTYVVAGQTKARIALASRTVTLYGTTGDAFCYQAFTSALSPVT